MHLTRLIGLHYRAFSWFDWSPQAGLNLLLGENGAGKTSLLEAAHLFAYGRSFRPSRRIEWIQNQQDGFQLSAHFQNQRLNENESSVLPKATRFSLKADKSHLQASHAEGKALRLSHVLQACPMLMYGPDSENLVQGRSEVRRRFLDWLVFHVEHQGEYMLQQARRSLSQRNTALRSQSGEAVLEVWNRALVTSVEALNQARREVLTRLFPIFMRHLACFDDALNVSELRYWPGFASQYASYSEALQASSERDRKQGFTSAGAHRADLKWIFEGDLTHRKLSRGQAKTVTLCLLLAAADVLAEVKQTQPMMLLDDVGSELDVPHQEKLAVLLQRSARQVLMTSTVQPEGFASQTMAMFHVKHGCNPEPY